MTPLLLCTHLLAAAAGGLLVRWWMLRHLEIREIDGHAALELQHHDDGTTMTDTPPADRRRSPMLVVLVVVLVASVLVITIGVSAYLDNRRRDAQAAADQRQRDCIIGFTNQLANTYAARATAAARLERAQAAKDRAQDRVFSTVYDARAVPPRATSRDFDRSLARLVHAQRHLNRVKAQVAKIRAAHPLPAPRKAKRCLR